MTEFFSGSAGNSWRDQFRFSYLNPNLKEFLSMPPQLSAVFQLHITALPTSKYSSAVSPGFPVQLLALTRFSCSPHIDPTPYRNLADTDPSQSHSLQLGPGFPALVGRDITCHNPAARLRCPFSLFTFDLATWNQSMRFWDSIFIWYHEVILTLLAALVF